MTTETKDTRTNKETLTKDLNKTQLEQLLETATETGQVFEALGKCNAVFELRTHTSVTLRFYKNLEDGVVFRQQPDNTVYAVVRHNDALVYVARIEK